MGYTINLNDSNPAIPVGKTGVKWQKGTVPADPAQPVPVSAYVDAAGAVLKTNGVMNVVQNLLNLVNGSGISITDDGSGDITIAVSNSASLVLAVHQVAHGFTTGKAVYYTGSAWALAKADAAGTLGIGIVSYVGADDFNLFISGYISGLSALTAGQYYFVSDSSAGALTATEPTTSLHFSNPLLFALSTTTGIVLPFRPSVIEPSGILTIQNKTGNYTAVAGDVVLCDTSLGGFTVTLPASAANTAKTITVKKVSLDANVLLVNTTGGDTIDDNPTATIVAGKTSLTLLADGTTTWQVT